MRFVSGAASAGVMLSPQTTHNTGPACSGWGGPAVGTWGLLQGSVMPGPTDMVLVPLGLAVDTRGAQVDGGVDGGQVAPLLHIPAVTVRGDRQLGPVRLALVEQLVGVVEERAARPPARAHA